MAECGLRLGEEPDKGTLSCAKAIEVKLLRRYQVEGEDLQEVREFVLLKPFPNCRLAQYELLQILCTAQEFMKFSDSLLSLNGTV